MTFSLYIDQLTLQHWEGKIDLVDCAIVSFLLDLNPDNPKIREHMWRGHFLIKREWLLEELPMLGIGEQALYKRLRKLRELKIVSVLHKTVDGNKTLAYFKLSGLFWKIRTKRHKAASDAAKETYYDDENDGKAIVSRYHGSSKSHSLLVSEPSSPETSNESIKDSFIPSRDEPPKRTAHTRGEEKKKKELTRSRPTRYETCPDCTEKCLPTSMTEWDGLRICDDCARRRRDANVNRDDLEVVEEPA